MLPTRLRKALLKQTKAVLVEILVELAKEDRNLLRRLAERIDLEAPPKNLPRRRAKRSPMRPTSTSVTSTAISTTTTKRTPR